MATEETSATHTMIMASDDKENKDNMELATLTHVEDEGGGDKPNMDSGLAMHAQQSLSPEEIKQEKRFVLKMDFILLPLLASMYFLASLVSTLLCSSGLTFCLSGCVCNWKSLILAFE